MTDYSNTFDFLDGPPFINGNMHHGHALVSSIKDTNLRFKEKQGYDIDFNFGFDEHGLPLEQAVEKEIGKLDLTKDDNLKLFCDTARNIISTYTDKWINCFNKLNRKIDTNKQYHTSDINYMNKLWSNFNELYKKGLIYRSYKVMPYSPKLGCSLSNFEANSNYMTINDNTVTVAFPAMDKMNNIIEKTFLIAWTTTPWSLVGNMGLGVNKDIIYCMVSYNDNFYWVAQNLIDSNFNEKVEIINMMPGKDLAENYSYKNIFNVIEYDGYMIHCADYITDSSGTGIVHLAPMFGADDFNTMNMKELPSFLDQHLNLTKNIPELEINNGAFLLDIEIPVIKYLAHNHLLFNKKKIKHQYPMCWRTDTKLVYYANSAWFLNVTKIKQDLINNVKTINWHPKEVAEKRFNNWIANSIDWCLSRNRIWGTPLPILVSKDNNDDIIIIKDINHYETLVGHKVNDLHLDTIGNKTIMINDKEYKLMGDVFDCWYESGMACIINQKTDTFKPFDFITESLDQTRGWFYTLNVLSTAIYNMPAFKNVKVSGLIMANDGKKMSKRLMNYTDPMELIEKYGSDMLRLYLISSPASKGESFNFNDEDLMKLYKKFIPFNSGINMFKSYSIRINDEHIIKKYSPLDIFIIKEMLKFIETITCNLNKYDTSNLDTIIVKMIDTICNIYIRFSRDRMNMNEGTEEYNNCFMVLSWVFNNFVNTVYPIMPSYFDEWTNIIKDIKFKNEIKTSFDEEYNFDIVFEIIENGRKLRDDNNLKLTRSVLSMDVYLKNKDINNASNCVDYIMNELNIENVYFKDIEILDGKYKPIFGIVGKHYKKDTKKICNIIMNAKSIEELNEHNITQEFYIKETFIDDTDNYKYLIDSKMVIGMDINNSDDIIMKESLLMLKKEINSKKKDLGYNWYDNVTVYLKENHIFDKYIDYMKKIHMKYVWMDDNMDYEYTIGQYMFSISSNS